ncbi:hypothetical protein [Actinoplanes solisilvae]|uniref:hypothetical protein n=1 Tax=Actinoplanes solisilvae TaxID=2486853 RepID=UPI000FD83D5C|nr:hypothetical protein [Actinoplanes solisilvae]
MATAGTTVYLWRPHGLVAYDLTTGLERLVITSPVGEDIPDNPATLPVAADVAGDRLVVSRPVASCRPMLLNLTSLSGLRDLPLTALGCTQVTGLRLSPSAGRLAVSYRTATGSRVAVLATEDGAVLADRAVDTGTTIALAWPDDRNLNGAAIHEPDAAKRTPFFLKTFRVTT